jgi:hypothetical protein
MFNNAGLRYNADVLIVKTTVESAINNPLVHLGKDALTSSPDLTISSWIRIRIYEHHHTFPKANFI